MNNWQSRLDNDICEAIACSPDDCLSLLRMPSSSYLSILSQNIRSVGANFSGLLTMMDRIVTPCDIIVLPECWLSRNPIIPVLRGYNSYKTLVNYNQNDGVVVYVKSDLTKIKVIEPKVAECNCLLITMGNDLAIFAIYRPYAFKDPSNFINSIDHILSEYKSFKNIILVGDINIDISADCNNTHTLDYLDVLSHHGLLPGHILPTHGKTCYDHMNLKTSMSAKVLVLETTLTDHFGVLLALRKNKFHVTNRTTAKINDEKLKLALSNINFTPVFNTIDPNLATKLFIDPIMLAITESTKVISLPRRRTPRKAWITPGLLKCMRHRDNLYKRAKKDPSNEILQVSYKRYRNFCINILRKAKLDYEKLEFTKAGKNS